MHHFILIRYRVVYSGNYSLCTNSCLLNLGYFRGLSSANVYFRMAHKELILSSRYASAKEVSRLDPQRSYFPDCSHHSGLGRSNFLFCLRESLSGFSWSLYRIQLRYWPHTIISLHSIYCSKLFDCHCFGS